MEQRSNYAGSMVAQFMLKKEECASDMEQRSKPSFAAVMDAATMLKQEECAIGMEQNANYAAVMDAQK